ncbi:hypothetical protein ASE73_14365 [Sphingomonas sp. Leaf24]|uniref:hypothetical protein n=1 Tax=unclassified Sphingomonas TaxID=196159 RepID=UPI0006FF4529|nr:MULTISPECIES: hypothetical protein [unclassified Sphingomonas]KQM22416.1 hypothetical protein ASE50_12545 [Sphingomonas sp. Leaf5]KQM94008.1 hypothetical protein ASE73_14365 [Sphingomonas sp. Leaf24]
MSDGNRNGYGDNATDDGIARRSESAFDRHDDSNRGPLDRAANAITGGSGGIDGALHRDDPNRGPFDRAENALHGHDDPNRGPLDRAANAVTSGSGGVAAATAGTSRGTGQTVSAIFDTEAEAQRAVADLRSAGVGDSALSVIARNNGTTTARDVDGEITDEHHESIARGVLGGGTLGAGLGVLALAIPGVGPLVAAGAIAATAVPGAMAIGAAAGAAAGTFNEVLKGHGISDEDASYYGEHLTGGGVLVTVDAVAADANVSDILRRNGGHSVNSPRATAL